MRLFVALAVLLACPTARADILHLRDRFCHCSSGANPLGRVTSATSDVRVRCVDAGSAAAPDAQVQYCGFAPGCRGMPSSQTENDGVATVEQSSTPDFEQMLREAYELADDGDVPAALRALRRIVTRAPDNVLDQLDSDVRAARGYRLDELMAGLRIRAALDPPRGQLFELKFATRYEAGALGRQLEPLYRHLLDKVYLGRTLEVWVAHRDEYSELQPDARRMVTDARLAAAMIGARVRFDPRLKIDIAERRRLVALRADLARLVAKVSALPGFTSLDRDADERDDPTLVEARRLAAEQAAARQAATSRPADE
jgi:hypothetical protein